MRLAGRLLAAAAALLTMGGAALAADVIFIPPPAPAPPVPVVAPAFSGPYWGTFGGVSSLALAPGVLFPMVGTQFGYNFGSGGMRFGFEVETEHFRVAPIVDATLNARAGFVINNRVLVYGQAGIGTLVPINPTLSFGTGVEFLLNPSLALFAEGKIFRFLGGGGPVGWAVRGGVNYYANMANLDATGAFDWGGLYFGASGGIYPGAALALFGVQVGYNLGGGPLVAGVEVETTHIYTPIAFVDASLNGRVGYAFGKALAYAEVGIGTVLTSPVITVGGGVELAVGDRVGLFAEADRIFQFGGGPVTPPFRITAGANVHFGR